MAWIVLIFIIALPLVEVAVFVRVGGEIGFLSAILLAVGAGIAGLAVLRRQSFATLARARESLERDEMPVAEVFDGVCLLLAGLLLLVPGFVTDVLGALLLVPAFRRGMRGWLGGRVRQRRQEGRPTVIEVEYHRVEDPDGDHRRE